MDYDKLTKAELIDKLNEQKHLAQAVEAKDQEIIRINNEMQKVKEQIKEQNLRMVGMISKEDSNKILNEALKDAEEKINLANQFLVSQKNALNLFNSALAVINQNDTLLQEKLK
jgi:predicted  nucleic acid-binding Zn-ribbon protein